ncbi:glycosyltransferase [Clostridium perfringens]|uniref:glycosyltransferase n=1 Tax=Clostridium perfringens TaxID=1502 RepID=UPI00285917B0|nr:glycosyltransferase family 2 protein [Clostridium perfringens]MDU7783902.1 glycosyltransferase [Clostridium perfringens]MDU7898890.1 glycosyltransferase [Clostridium perfringens]
MEKVSFVILHYMSYEDTVECIESILNNIEYSNYNIVVIDNNSTNDSGNKLIKKYKKNNLVEIVINTENLGFANGNNIGYRLAKERYKSDFIVIINNDTIIEQKDFINLIIKEYHKNKYHLLGPDIISFDGIHQNPQRLCGLSLEDVEDMLSEVKKNYLKNKFIDIFKIHNAGKKIKKIFKKQNEKKEITNPYFSNESLKNVQLHGACIIFSPIYIKNEVNAFYPETYMYGEEDILFYICKKKQYVTIFEPKIKILHKEDASTNYILNKEIKKRLFILKNSKESLEILHNIMKKDLSEENNEINI